jgi:hypothetical protein
VYHGVLLPLQVRVQQLTELEEVIAYKEAMARWVLGLGMTWQGAAAI